ncbi:hypothetical protein Rhopal_003496-T1 [Rhodotorula paludigena]|uniref:CBM1 domain-containing protein n=1 Tax=Rhodotorula paludigena TaxID=86838 RepID=A0AAV5GD69_9BASI|nr:hypothetical protein Rhopal_003496-T1 [Rhodotorula paludigena]
MLFLSTLLPLAIAAASLAEASTHPPARENQHARRADCVQSYGRCGGEGYSGSTCCTDGWTCVKQNSWYSQCVQGGAGSNEPPKATTTSSKAAASSVIATSAIASTTTTSARPPANTDGAVAIPAIPSDGPVGFASLNGGTTGGAGGAKTTVSDLKSLRAAVKGEAAAIVFIDGIIKGDGDTVDVGGNTSILPANGGGKDGLTGSGFRIKDTSNVIIRGLSLSKSPAPTDLIGIQKATNVWVDHCTFKSDLKAGKDDCKSHPRLDITHAGDFVSVTWNVFTNSWKTSLVGHSENNGKEDTGHLRVSYLWNHFYDVNSRLPSLRFGTGHIANNYYQDIHASGINSREGAEILVESNYFSNAKNPIETADYDGYVVVNDDNIYENSGKPDLSGVGSISPADLGYDYTLEAAVDIPSIVVSGAGAKHYSA